MMLPSGNDAAQSLAVYFGHMALLYEKGPGPHDPNINAEKYEEVNLENSISQVTKSSSHENEEEEKSSTGPCEPEEPPSPL